MRLNESCTASTNDEKESDEKVVDGPVAFTADLSSSGFVEG